MASSTGRFPILFLLRDSENDLYLSWRPVTLSNWKLAQQKSCYLLVTQQSHSDPLKKTSLSSPPPPRELPPFVIPSPPLPFVKRGEGVWIFSGTTHYPQPLFNQSINQFININTWDGVTPIIRARGSCIKRMTIKILSQ